MAASRRPPELCFNQSCPVCGRRLSIRLQLLGRRVYCQHCGGGFQARDESVGDHGQVRDRVEDLLARASRVLAEATAGEGDAAGFSG
jgi:hypothetical protein